jgi:transposase
MNGQPKQMTEHETKRARWLFMHPRADGRIIPQSATCYRCGQKKPMSELKEVGNEVYRCKGGCGA